MYAQEQNDSARGSGATYGAVTEGAGLLNGVANVPPPTAPPEVSGSSSLENPNIGDMMLPVDRTGVANVVQTPHPAEPPYDGDPHLSANVITQASQDEMIAQRAFPILYLNGAL